MTDEAEHLLELPHGFSPLGLLRKFALIGAGSLLFGLLLPSITALSTGVFFLGPMKDKIRSIHPDVTKRLEDFERQQQERKRDVSKIESSVLDGSVNADIRAQLYVLSEYKKTLNEKSPVSIQPLYLHVLMDFWPSMYTCLGCLIFLLNPRATKVEKLPSIPNGKTILLAAGVFLFSRWPLLTRNFWGLSAWRIAWSGRILISTSTCGRFPPNLLTSQSTHCSCQLYGSNGRSSLRILFRIHRSVDWPPEDLCG